MTDAPADTILHASAVAVGGRAVLFLGPSGSGKSSLSLQLMALGATLVADDRTRITRRDDGVIAHAMPALAGRIEARGVGILRATHVDAVPVALVVNLAEMETDRLPPRRSTNLLGISLPMLHNTGNPYFAAAILHYVSGGRDA